MRGRLADLKIDLIDVEQWPYAHVTVSYAAKGAPKQVSLTWKKWDTEAGFFMAGIDAEIAPGDTLVLTCNSGASLAARDGDLLDLVVADSTAFVFSLFDQPGLE